MIEPKRIESNEFPQKFVDLGNGKWYYNYDIKSKEVEVLNMDNEEPTTKTRWSYIQIKLNSKPDYKKCVEHIIREYITQSQEFDLINSYNRALFNLMSEEEGSKASSEYVDYLNKIKEIKDNIRKDFK